MPRNSGSANSGKHRPVTTPEGRENLLVSLAMDLAERRLREGTATSQEVTHFLKLGSSREMLEQERLRHENELTNVKIAAIASAERSEEMYRNALNAMRAYNGQEPSEIEGEYYED